MALINLLHRLQRLHQRGSREGDLAVWQYLSRTDGIAVADLPRGNAHLLRQQIQVTLDGETALGHPKPAECSRRRVVGINRRPVDINILIIVRPGRMSTKSLKHRSAERRVRPRVRHHDRLHSQQIPVLITSGCKCHLRRMTLRMHHDALFSRQLHLHRQSRVIGKKRRMMLHGHILFSAEAASYQLVDHMNLVKIPAQHTGTLVLRIVSPLVRRVDQRFLPFPVHDSNRTLRLQERMLRKRRLIIHGHHIGRVSHGLVRVAPHQMLMGQHIPGLMNQRRSLRQSLLR